MTDPTAYHHKPGCPALGGYGTGDNVCICQPPSAYHRKLAEACFKAGFMSPTRFSSNPQDHVDAIAAALASEGVVDPADLELERSAHLLAVQQLAALRSEGVVDPEQETVND